MAMGQEQIWGSVEEWGIERPGRRRGRKYLKRRRYLRRGIGVLCLFLLLGGLEATGKWPLAISQSVAIAEEVCTNVEFDVEQQNCPESLWEVCEIAQQLTDIDLFSEQGNWRRYAFFCRAARVVELWEFYSMPQSEIVGPFKAGTIFERDCYSLRDCTIEIYTEYIYMKSNSVYYPEYFLDSEIVSYDKINEIILSYAPFLHSYQVPPRH